MRVFNEYKNKIKIMECPVCGKERPYDWFVGRDPRCWKCRESKLEFAPGAWPKVVFDPAKDCLHQQTINNTTEGLNLVGPPRREKAMKKIINGKKYDTKTATFGNGIAGGLANVSSLERNEKYED